MVDHDLPAVPVVDSAGRPAGVVTAANASAKLEFHGGADLPTLLGGVRSWVRWRKADGLTAADLMTTPAPTMPADAPVHAALHHLAGHWLAQLCVVDGDGCLVGVLTHHDALRLFLRTDDAVRADIENRVPDTVAVRVADGIVTLAGPLYLRSVADHAEYTAKHVPGVIAVHNNLTYSLDDLAIHGL